MPGLAYNVNDSLDIGGAVYVADFNWYYGFFTAFTLYTVFSLLWPDQKTLIPSMIEGIAQDEDPRLENHDLEKSPGAVVELKGGVTVI